jgi:hypothetical protein
MFQLLSSLYHDKLLPMGGKLTVKIQILLDEDDRKNMISDLQELSKQVTQRTELPVKLTRQDIVRGVLRNLHKNIEAGKKVAYPPVLTLVPEEGPEIPAVSKRRKTK